MTLKVASTQNRENHCSTSSLARFSDENKKVAYKTKVRSVVLTCFATPYKNIIESKKIGMTP